MTGKPAARITDRVAYGEIVTGSLTVLIGSQGGVACSVCPGGVTVGSPVNPQLGAKVLVGGEDLDFALPGVLPVVWQRQYSSYVNVEHGAACGPLGYGWKLPQQLRLELLDDACLLHDAAGRVITFEPLPAGQSIYSASEDLWLLRGGPQAAWAAQPRWAHVPAVVAVNPELVLAAGGDGEVLWVFAPAPASALAAAPAWRLIAQLDRFGRSQRYEYAAEHTDGSGSPGEPPDIPLGHLVALTDGVGRRYRLRHARIHAGKAAQGLWGADDGWRLVAVELQADPLHPLSAAAPLTLVRYGYDATGHLTSVHDRAGVLVREFEYEHHRIVAHRQQGGPWHRYRYRYEGAQERARVIEHTNQEGLAYHFEYLKQPPSAEGRPRTLTRVTDSLGRVEHYHFEGEAGLQRLVLHQRADGSAMRYEYDGAARLVASTDPLGRTTRLARDGQGRIIGARLPGGIASSRQYDEASGRLEQSQDPTGAVTRYRHDGFGRLIEVTQADGTAERYHYPEPSEQPLTCELPRRTEDAKGGIKHLAYSDAGLLVAYTDCSGQRTEWRHDRFGELIETTDALGQRTRHERDAQGRVAATHLPNGQTERYQYDASGQLRRIEPAEGAGAHAIDLAYDLWGRLSRRSHGGLTLQFEYDLAGRLTRLINENGAQSRFAWDVMDRLTQEEGFDQRLQRYHWDAAGQLTQADDGNARSQQSTHYRWDDAGRLAERSLPATDAASAQTHRYEWDAAGRLMAASVYTQQPEQQQLQSRIELQRDVLGRITGETQRLYRPGLAEQADPDIEFEHTIAHRLDALGNRQASQLQGVGAIEWLLYGSGHVHGLAHNGHSLIDFERDALHREVKRSLHGSATPTQPVHIQRQWDALGRLHTLTTHGLHGQAQTPQALIGQLEQRRYHYDALGQLTALQTAAGTLRYGYDAAGRLRAMQPGQQAQQAQRWDVDPAGNRLPGRAQESAAESTDWAAQVLAHWRQERFNLLGQGQANPPGKGPVTHWPDNRIGYSSQAAWRYDACGNRTEELKADGQRQLLGYDGAHQLVDVKSEGPAIGQEQEQQQEQQLQPQAGTSRYVYDALGRRLKNTTSQGAAVSTRYYGWDGDRLIHTEQVHPHHLEERQITHTVYEPGSFTPLLRLSTQGRAKAKQQPVLGLMLQSAKDEGTETEEAPMAQMLEALPKDMKQALEQSLRQAMQEGIPRHMQALMPDQGKNTAESLRSLRHELEKQEQAQRTLIDIHHYHCDHLGTPIALSDQEQNIVWAARLDPWGNVEEEFDPNQIDQSIRLPGQHHDRDTGLYYNRHRYYDPSIGSYINQDPIGLAGGVNTSIYVDANPLSFMDPTGLQAYMCAAGLPAWCPPPPRPAVPIARPDGNPWQYGCGDAGTDKKVPDRPGGYDFLPACRNHDICYGDKSGPSKSTCDANFFQDMMQECKKYGYFVGLQAPRVGANEYDGNPLNNSPFGRTKEDCAALAATYYLGVYFGGGDAFKNARR